MSKSKKQRDKPTAQVRSAAGSVALGLKDGEI